MKITYSRVSLAEVEQLVEYRIRFALELSGDQPIEKIDSLRTQLLSYFTKATTEGECISFIAKSNDTVAGIGSVQLRSLPGNFKNPGGKWGYIMNMYTAPEFRNKGICSSILNLLINEAALQGVTAFELHATEEGKHVYLNHEFSIHPQPTLRRYIN